MKLVCMILNTACTCRTEFSRKGNKFQRGVNCPSPPPPQMKFRLDIPSLSLLLVDSKAVVNTMTLIPGAHPKITTAEKTPIDQAPGNSNNNSNNNSNALGPDPIPGLEVPMPVTGDPQSHRNSIAVTIATTRTATTPTRSTARGTRTTSTSTGAVAARARSIKRAGSIIAMTTTATILTYRMSTIEAVIARRRLDDPAVGGSTTGTMSAIIPITTTGGTGTGTNHSRRAGRRDRRERKRNRLPRRRESIGLALARRIPRTRGRGTETRRRARRRRKTRKTERRNIIARTALAMNRRHLRNPRRTS